MYALLKLTKLLKLFRLPGLSKDLGLFGSCRLAYELSELSDRRVMQAIQVEPLV